ncbi:hypothetical protein LTR36_010754 [Oleoguttula mirabilis]|uniref:Uncharacterized protein n=1 Tax=Oleoguttula mirabilis TaxID=1507867 RepID=A0AAV9JRF5_9PEZI|nr:hypothetical protein LTR36_010754 [Oleoguttula mirabilis]
MRYSMAELDVLMAESQQRSRNRAEANAQAARDRDLMLAELPAKRRKLNDLQEQRLQDELARVQGLAPPAVAQANAQVSNEAGGQRGGEVMRGFKPIGNDKWADEVDPDTRMGAKEAEELNVIDNYSLYFVDADSDKNADAPRFEAVPAPVANHELEGRVEPHWNGILNGIVRRNTGKNPYVESFRAWLINKSKGYCAFSWTVTGEKAKRNNSQTTIQACDGCVKQRRPCIDWVVGKLTILPQRTVQAEERYSYFD